MSADLFSPRRLKVAPVAPLAPGGAPDPKIGATRASDVYAVAPRKSLATKGRSQWSHRGHPKGKGHGNPVSSNRGRVARSILCFKIGRVAPVASRLISQWLNWGHLDFAGGSGGPSRYRARAPPDLMT